MTFDPFFTADSASSDPQLAAFGAWADAAPALLWVTDPEGRCVYLSRRWYDFTGQAPGAGLGWGWAEMLHPEDRERVSEEFGRSVRSGRTCISEYRLRHRSGEYRWVTDTGEPRLDGAGRLAGFVGSVMDITDRKLAELELRRSREELQRRLAEEEMLFETAPVGIALFDREGRYARVNRAVADLHNRSAKECVGLTPAQVHCIAAEPVERLLREVSETGSTVTNCELRFPGAGPGGSDMVWLMNIAPTRDGPGRVTGAWAVVQDITEVARLRDQLAQAQKLESIGRLAGGVAHDFNNLLTVISGYAQQAAARLPPGSPEAMDIGHIRSAADRAAEFTRQLLAFARRQVVQPRALEFGELLTSNRDLIRRLIGEDIRLEYTALPKPALVLIDPGQCTQILLNLAANARDAMPDGGTLSIRAEVVTLGPGDIASGETARPGPYVRLTVADTGVGMPAHVRRRVFEPFFTTKSGGRGIGLASCYGIVKQAHGLIDVRSAEGGGTTFTIHLPVTTERAEPAAAPATDGPALPGDETVLLVEDEPMVREMISKTLRVSGYRVTDASSTEQAMRLVTAAERPFDLIITDVVLPGGSGLDLAHAIHEAKPSSRVLLMSGYAEDSGGERLPFRLLAKPFSLDEFLQAVRSVLDGPLAPRT